MHTGLAVLNELQRTQPYEAIDQAGKQLADTLSRAAERAGVPLRIHRAGGMFTLFFSSVAFEAGKPHTDAAQYSQFHTRALEAGILLPPSPWETCFLSPCHLEPPLLQRLTDGLTHAITG
jgi:glutamate-1-semialdehyde 2,1-aminomutase